MSSGNHPSELPSIFCVFAPFSCCKIVLWSHSRHRRSKFFIVASIDLFPRPCCFFFLSLLLIFRLPQHYFLVVMDATSELVSSFLSCFWIITAACATWKKVNGLIMNTTRGQALLSAVCCGYWRYFREVCTSFDETHVLLTVIGFFCQFQFVLSWKAHI